MENTPEATAEARPASLEIWYADPSLAPALEATLADFERAQPHITLSLMLQEAQTFRQMIRDSLDGGAGPDMILGDATLMANLAASGHLTDLSEREVQMMELGPARAAYQTLWLDNRPYGLPFLLSVPLIYQNTSLTDREIQDYDAFVAAAEAHGAQIPPSFWQTSPWLDVINQTQPILQNGQVNTTVDGFAAYLERLLTLQQLDGVMFGTSYEPFINGEVGLLVGGLADYGTLQAALGDDLRFMDMRLAADNPGLVLADVRLMMLSINATQASLDAGYLLMAYLMQQEQQRMLTQESGWLGYAAPSPVLQVVSPLGVPALPEAHLGFYTRTLPQYETALAQVLAGVRSPQEAAENALRID